MKRIGWRAITAHLSRWAAVTAMLFGAFALLTASRVHADVLVPDTFVPLDGTTVVLEPWLAGTVVEDVMTAFSFAAYDGIVSGTVQNRVVLADDGTYDFYWRVFNDANSAGAVYSWRIGGFVTDNYLANWRIDGLGDVAPSMAYLFGSLGGFVNFYFVDEAGASTLLPGMSSNFFFFDTDATSYSLSAFYDVTNTGQTQISEAYQTFAPHAVPTPATLLLLLSGGLLLLRRRRTV